MKFLKAITATAFLGLARSMSSPAVAGWGCGWGCGWGAALAGFGVGAMVGSALAPAYVGPPPPDYYYSYGPADYEDYYYGPPDYEPPTAAARAVELACHSHTQATSQIAIVLGFSADLKTSGLNSSQQKNDARFKAAQAKAKRAGVDALTQADIDGLSSEQLKQIRGY